METSNTKLNDKVKVELETDTKSLSNNPYVCAVKAKHFYFINSKTVGHIPQKISCYIYFFIKEEKEKFLEFLSR